MTYKFSDDPTQEELEYEMELGFRVLANVIEEGECWIWQGYVTSGARGGFPAMKFSEGGCMTVRRIIMGLDGRPAAFRQPVITTCGDKKCVNPAHLKASTISEVLTIAGQKGALSTFAKRVSTARQKRATQAKLTMEKAHEIRASNESAPILALRYGVDKSLICRIKRNEAWVELENNPFAGLMRLAA